MLHGPVYLPRPILDIAAHIIALPPSWPSTVACWPMTFLPHLLPLARQNSESEEFQLNDNYGKYEYTWEARWRRG